MTNLESINLTHSNLVWNGLTPDLLKVIITEVESDWRVQKLIAEGFDPQALIMSISAAIVGNVVSLFSGVSDPVSSVAIKTVCGITLDMSLFNLFAAVRRAKAMGIIRREVENYYKSNNIPLPNNFDNIVKGIYTSIGSEVTPEKISNALNNLPANECPVNREEAKGKIKEFIKTQIGYFIKSSILSALGFGTGAAASGVMHGVGLETIPTLVQASIDEGGCMGIDYVAIKAMNKADQNTVAKWVSNLKAKFGTKNLALCKHEGKVEVKRID